MNKLVTSGYIAKLFKQADKNTIIRRPNLRRFAEQNDVEYYVHDTAWLINFDDFMSKINPQGEQVKWIVNYDQLLPQLKKINRRESKMWKKYMQCLGIKKSVTPRKK